MPTDENAPNVPVNTHGAGLMLLYKGEDGDRVLFVRHGERGSWEFPGGAVEANESAEEAALRETGEEIGASPYGRVSLLMRNTLTGVDYSTFIAHVEEPFEPDLGRGDGELTDWQWAAPNAPPEPLHPGVRVALERMRMDELDVAKAIISGELSSPQQYESAWFFAMRFSGTGVSYRPEYEEYVWRPIDVYLTPRFKERIQGLPIIWVHPPGQQLNTKEYRRRVIGAVMLPFFHEDELWVIGRIHDHEAAEVMRSEELSTSPAVVFRDPSTNKTIPLDDGKHLLEEGDPSYCDHLAVVSLGVWDKGGEPTGIAVGEPEMAGAEVTLAEAQAEIEEAAPELPELRSDSAGLDELTELGELVAMIGACVDQMEARR